MRYFKLKLSYFESIDYSPKWAKEVETNPEWTYEEWFKEKVMDKVKGFEHVMMNENGDIEGYKIDGTIEVIEYSVIDNEEDFEEIYDEYGESKIYED